MQVEAIKVGSNKSVQHLRGETDLGRSQHGAAMKAARSESAGVRLAVKIGQGEYRCLAA